MPGPKRFKHVDVDDTLESDSINTEKADITGETFIRATRGSDTSSTSSGNRKNVFDGESKDVRGEFNSSQQFVPDKDGEYEIYFIADIRGSTGAGDKIQAFLRDVTNSTNVSITSADAPDSSAFVDFSFQENLTAGTKYEVQVTNNDSSFVVSKFETTGRIKRSVVQ